VATNASASHAGRTNDVMATSSASIEERWITPQMAATFLRAQADQQDRISSGSARAGWRCYLDTTASRIPRMAVRQIHF
jgi:hypothetical protein